MKKVIVDQEYKIRDVTVEIYDDAKVSLGTFLSQEAVGASAENQNRSTCELSTQASLDGQQWCDALLIENAHGCVFTQCDTEYPKHSSNRFGVFCFPSSVNTRQDEIIYYEKMDKLIREKEFCYTSLEIFGIEIYIVREKNVHKRHACDFVKQFGKIEGSNRFIISGVELPFRQTNNDYIYMNAYMDWVHRRRQ